MTLEEMKSRKIELGLTNEMIAEESGVPLSTVQKIFSGLTKAPRKLTIEAITRVLEGATGASTPTHNQEKHTRIDYRDIELPGDSMVDDSAPAYTTKPEDRRYTIDDYYALPDDQRVELIDGVFYDMGAPALVHQKILGDLYILFRECADRHGMPCEVYLSPCDVRLDMDNYTMVQPDLLVICREYDIRAIRYEGAPDLVVEILSPSTRSKDMFLKLYKYQNAGVREYWVVDPKHRKVTVHYFETDEYQSKTYDFNSEIPIEISHGECSIDFSKIMDGLKKYYDQ